MTDTTDLREIIANIEYFCYHDHVDQFDHDSEIIRLVDGQSWKALRKLAGIGPTRWREDELGLYWDADMFDANGKRYGIVGSYYDLEEDGKRKAPTR